MGWAALHTRSYYSLLHSTTKPIKLAERAVQMGLPAVALTDEGCITGSIAFIKALKNTCQCGHHKNSHGDNVCYGNSKKCKCEQFVSANIKPILGTEFHIACGNNNENSAGLIVLSKNLAGWKKLISATSEANKLDNLRKETPHLTLDQLSKYCTGEWVGMSGGPGSEIANALFDYPERVYFARTYEEARSLSSKTNYKRAIALAGKYHSIFGKDNFFLEIHRMNHEGFPGGEVIANAIRCVAKATGIPCVASADAFYPSPEDFDDQQTLVCSDLDTTYDGVTAKFPQPENSWLKKFFDSSKYYLPGPAEIKALHTNEEVNNSLLISEQCELYNVLSKPILPLFECPNGKTPDEYLKELCAKGWKEKIDNRVLPADIPKYKQQIREELSVIQGAGLSSYFLIVADYCDAARKMGQLLGNGRGSAAGSLISYLTHITKVDPVKYDLMFERFYNAGRNTADRVSLPDIDTDFEDRDQIIPYIVNKYGADRVGQMVTFSRIQGRGALKEVFRVRFPDIPMDQVNKITAELPDEAEISDKLQEMKEAGEEASIIMWALEANSKNLKQYCYLDKDGNIQGEYATAFRRAYRLEGTKKSQSKHPSGLVIANNPLADMVPMIHDKTTKKSICGMEMDDLSDLSCVKFDILEVAVLRKLHGVSLLLSKGNID